MDTLSTAVSIPYHTCAKVARIWSGLSGRKCSAQRIRALCVNGRIEGAYKAGEQWMIPANAQDIRRKIGKPKKIV
jgi:hypothetical protein